MDTFISAITNFFYDIKIFFGVLVGGLFVLIGNSLYNFIVKYFNCRPKLFITVEKPLPQRINNNYQTFEFSWRTTIRIKNNSSFTAYNIKLSFPKNHNISDITPAENLIEKLKHLNSNEELELEVRRVLIEPFLNHVNFEIEENGSIVILPGMKGHSNLFDQLNSMMPNELKNIKIDLVYSNDIGKKFKTFFEKLENIETNKLKYFNRMI